MEVITTFTHENVVVLDLESELIQLGMTRIRDYENDGAKFTHDANGVLRSAVDLALTELPNDEEVGVLHAALPYDAKHGEILVQEIAKGGLKAFGDARLVTASFDARLDADGHIVPGIGAFEDRYLGAASSVMELADDPASESSGGDENALKTQITKKLSSWFAKD
ncbi:hypothetical protein BBJ28_00003691 [Nothophytophthora sp. Chile5]|nr:hypothetical protein BBJ28_00003691 [Nothophytophthora sp. Chile5]